jgi:hypothetical protein
MEGNNVNGDMPTEKQLAVIRRLAKKANSNVDLSKVTTKQEASKVIEELIAKNGNGNNVNQNDCRDKKVAFGLAAKLVFCKYKEQKMDFLKSDAFFKEVEEFYQKYTEHQDRAIKGSVL